MPAPEFLPVDERKAKALKLLGPGASATRVHFAIMAVERAKLRHTYSHPQKAAHKKWARQLAKILHALRRVLRHPDALPGLVDAIETEATGRMRFTDDELKRWREAAEAAATGTIPPGYGKPYARAKHVAAEHAAKLLHAQGQPLICTRKSPFLRLAALLFGDEDANLYEHCRSVKRRFRD